ncbi:hypothetical protein FH581_022135 [Leptospira weilii]|uniref:hypothetical protein n=1 Tax=Leptospira weilii TaxID=28184 RepID=UPI001EF29213|nr:hypothetical protein [Leptospira weilii]ULH26934.1 hypothetical protein FH586_01610 [Leptospira weilii]UPY80592.1 hypothetical protein FH581_021130 [Leptospira weilii]UPY80784.1 hypothetical protein FH581_022135 [Leptospira weilii]
MKELTTKMIDDLLDSNPIDINNLSMEKKKYIERSLSTIRKSKVACTVCGKFEFKTRDILNGLNCGNGSSKIV